MGRNGPGGGGVEIREYKSGRKSIRILFSYKGVKCRETLKGLTVTAANLKYAQNVKAAVDLEIGKGEFDYLARFPDSKRGRKLAGGSSTAKPRDIEENYLESLNKRPLEAATVEAYESALRAWVIPEFGNIPLVQIDAKMIQREKDELLARLSPKSVSNYLGVLRDFLAWAVNQDYVQTNAAEGVSVGRQARKGSKRKPDRIEPFDRDDVDAILNAVDGDLFRRYLAFAFYTGMRPSEMYALKWDNVDWRRGTVFVQEVRVHGKLKSHPKTDAGRRDVLLLPIALKALQKQRKVTELSEHGCVWINPLTKRPFIRYAETAGRWKNTLRRAKIRYRNQYQTRHTYASNLLSDGENPWFVARQLGHSDVEMVMRVYGRWIEKAGRIEGHSWISDYGAGGQTLDKAARK